MWGDIQTEPKRTNRFLILGNLPVFTIQQVTLPSLEVGEAKVDYVANQFWYPGKVTWQPVSMTLVDAIAPEGITSNVIMQMIQNAGYEFPGVGATTDPASPLVQSFSKFRFNQATGLIAIQSIDAEGFPIDQWTLQNSWIKSIAPGELTMADANIVNIKITFRYDWAEYESLL